MSFRGYPNVCSVISVFRRLVLDPGQVQLCQASPECPDRAGSAPRFSEDRSIVRPWTVTVCKLDSNLRDQ